MNTTHASELTVRATEKTRGSKQREARLWIICADTASKNFTITSTRAFETIFKISYEIIAWLPQFDPRGNHAPASGYLYAFEIPCVVPLFSTSDPF